MNAVVTSDSEKLIDLSWHIGIQRGGGTEDKSNRTDLLHFYNIQYLLANYPKTAGANECAEWTLDNLLGQITNTALLKTAVDLVNRHLGFD